MLDQQEACLPSGKNHKNGKDSKVGTPEEPVAKKEAVQKVTLNIWDFAGQSAYNTAHQVFFYKSELLHCGVCKLSLSIYKHTNIFLILLDYKDAD